jgi:hypothetical protein
MIASTTPNDRYRTFAKIEEISQKLLAKGAIARFVDKGEDSNTVAKLIERLREAILFYQVSEDRTSVPSTIDIGSRYRNSKRSTNQSLISP